MRQSRDIAANLKRHLGDAVALQPFTAAGVKAAVGRLQQLLAHSHGHGHGHVMRVAVCGGDGSVAWVVDELAAAGLSRRVAVAVIPTGTGNDMALSLGWGGTATAMAPPRLRGRWWEDATAATAWLECVRSCAVKPADVWRVDVDVATADSGAEGSVVRVRGGKAAAVVGCTSFSVPMINYCSVGADARLCFAVETHRTGARWLNRVLYMVFGLAITASLPTPVSAVMKTVTMGGGADGADGVDGPWSSFMMLNSTSYGGGVKLWNMGRRRRGDGGRLAPSSLSDGKLDVLGVRSMFHLGIAVSMRVPVPFHGGLHQLAQRDHVQVTFKDRAGPVHLQVDGEGYLLHHPVSVTTSKSHQTLLLGV